MTSILGDTSDSHFLSLVSHAKGLVSHGFIVAIYPLRVLKKCDSCISSVNITWGLVRKVTSPALPSIS